MNIIYYLLWSQYILGYHFACWATCVVVFSLISPSQMQRRRLERLIDFPELHSSCVSRPGLIYDCSARRMMAVGVLFKVGIYKVRLLDLLLVQYRFSTHMISFARIMYFHLIHPWGCFLGSRLGFGVSNPTEWSLNPWSTTDGFIALGKLLLCGQLGFLVYKTVNLADIGSPWECRRVCTAPCSTLRHPGANCIISWAVLFLCFKSLSIFHIRHLEEEPSRMLVTVVFVVDVLMAALWNPA